MRILFLTKQQYMGKDLLRDRFGRFYEFPRVLALRGHVVLGVCLRYWADADATAASKQFLDHVEWQSYPLGWNWLGAFSRHFRRAKLIANDFAPEVVVGASDAMHAMIAASLAVKIDIPSVIDLYDDFESYGTARFPGVKKGLRYAISKATAISTVSTNLEAKVKDHYRAPGIVRTVSNAVCPEIFHPRDKMSARRELGLPEFGTLIGTAGTLSVARGTRILLQAFEMLSRENDQLKLVLAGPLARGLIIPTSEKIRYLGDLPHARVGQLFNALDVGVVSNRQNQFAENGFPQKFYEMVASRLPLVCADVGVMRTLLTARGECLYDPESAASLACAIEKQLNQPTYHGFSAPTWQDRGSDFHQLLEDALAISRRVRGK